MLQTSRVRCEIKIEELLRRSRLVIVKVDLHLLCRRVVHILNLDDGAMAAFAPMCQHLAHGEDTFAEGALSDRVLTLNGLVTDLILLENSHATALTDYIHEVAIVQLMRPQQELIVGQLIGALCVVTLEADGVEILLLQLVQLLERGVLGALARR